MTARTHTEKPASPSWWTPERVDQLRQFYADGIGPSEAARRMSANSRNAVIGKADRLGLVLNKSVRAPGKPKPSTVRATVDRREPPAAPPRLQRAGQDAHTTPVWPSGLATEARAEDAFVAPPRRLVALLDLDRGQCRWPFGERPVLFCGAPTVDPANPEVPYCACHRGLAYLRGTAAGPTTARKMREART